MMRKKNNWFELIPARRFVIFRSLIAMFILLFLLPTEAKLIENYVRSSFRDPMFAWLPQLPAEFGMILVAFQFVAGWLLFFGVKSRFSSSFLFVSILYVFLLDHRHYFHTPQFFLCLLFIFTVSNNPLSLVDLMRGKNQTAVWEAWPEYLVRYQVAIIFFYAALDKVFSPFWGATGSFFTYEFGRNSLFGSILHAQPGLFSISVIVCEFALAAIYMFNPIRRWVVWFNVGFILAMEFLAGAHLFTMGLLASVLLLQPLNSTTAKSHTAVRPSKAR